jgi:hypothetical protein
MAVKFELGHQLFGRRVVPAGFLQQNERNRKGISRANLPKLLSYSDRRRPTSLSVGHRDLWKLSTRIINRLP